MDVVIARGAGREGGREGRGGGGGDVLLLVLVGGELLSFFGSD